MKFKYIFIISSLVLFFSCKPELDEFKASSGNVDFSNYVALGNSLTAGYADGALYNSAQKNSFPNILSGQFAKAGGGTFVQPEVMSEYGIEILGLEPGKLKLGFKVDCLEETSLAPIPDIGPLDGSDPIGYTVNNLGVPGARSSHLLFPGYAVVNPYFKRFATNPMASVIEDAVALDPTFFTLWIGNNDVLGYATSGGENDTITSQQWFSVFLNTALEYLTTNGAKGAIANIPDISSIPFFTTVPANGYVLTQEQADILNTNLGPLGFSYQAGPNYFIVEDPSAPPLYFRQMVEGELLLLTVPQDEIKCEYLGGFDPDAEEAVPIPKHFVLSLDEIENINAAISGYNQTIKTLAAEFDLAFVDMHAEFNNVKNGIVSDGITLSADFITGNAFSLDGIHGTPMGYAHITNTFIRSINAKYSSNLPLVSITDYPANVVP